MTNMMINMTSHQAHNKFVGFVVAAVALALPVPAMAQTEPPAGASGLASLLSCRSLVEDQARLACFDREAGKLEAQTARRDLILLDRDQIAKMQKDRFGRSSADLSVQAAASGDDAKTPEFIEDHIQSAQLSAEGKWIFTLTNGAVWRQTELASIRRPKAGDAIRIRKGALGSFMAAINGWPPIRVKRVK